MNNSEPLRTTVQSYDAVVVGAGFAGVYALYKLRRQGLSVKVLEAGAGVGGTWYHNRYPGARCDIESLDYSYSFSEELQQEWSWSERYASQPELLEYINHVVDRFGLRRDIQLDTRVTSAQYRDGDCLWVCETEAGERFESRYLIMATGVLSMPQVPTVAGLEEFRGKWYHSGDWPHEGVDVRGKRVAVIGTGSSGTQMIPLLAEEADELLVFQRTPNYCMPAQNHPMDPEVEREWKKNYPQKREFARRSAFGHNQVSNPNAGTDLTREERLAELENRWQLGGLYMMRAFKDILRDKDVNDEAAEYVRQKIRETVKDPGTAQVLSPRNLPIGTKRLCSGTGFYETFNRDNVELVDVRQDPIERITARGVRTASQEHEVDVIVFATGFDAMTGALNRLNPVGRGGRQLREHWADGPRTYLGLTVHGFPNMFIIAGPGSPSVFSNMVNSIEQHVEWIADAVKHLDSHGYAAMEATASAETDWVQHVNDVTEGTLYRDSRATWFYGANTPGKPQVFMPYLGGVGPYVQRITAVADAGYEGFELRKKAMTDTSA